MTTATLRRKTFNEVVYSSEVESIIIMMGHDVVVWEKELSMLHLA